MNFAHETLKKLIAISPIIDDRINEELSNVLQDDFHLTDSINNLLNVAIIEFDRLCEQNGIRFVNGIEDLFCDYYHVDYLLFMYKQFNTVDFYENLIMIPDFFETVEKEIEELSNDEILNKMLEIYNKLLPSEFTHQMYMFLHDKIINTEAYGLFVRQCINEYIIRKENVDFSKTIDLSLMLKIQKYTALFQNILQDLKLRKLIELNFQQIISKCNIFMRLYSNPINYVVLERRNELNEDFVIEYLNKLESSYPIFSSYYRNLDKNKISDTEKICIIIAELVKEYLFGIKSKFPDEFETIVNKLPIEHYRSILSNSNVGV